MVSSEKSASDSCPSDSSSSHVYYPLSYQPDAPTVHITEWSSNGIPTVNNKIEVSVDSEGEGKFKLQCRDKLTEVNYTGEQYIPNYEKYMVLVVEDGKVTCQPCTFFRMKPKLNLPVRTSDKMANLSYTEKMDEINEKFGSKKSIRRIEERKKNAIAYGSEDYQNMKQKATELNLSVNANADANLGDNKTANTNYDDPFLMPPRNDAAVSVEKVYNIFDIVPQSLIESMKLTYNFGDIKSHIGSPLVQLFATKAKEDTEKGGCLFLDALLKFKTQRLHSLNKLENNGIEGVDSIDVIHTLLEKYSISTIRSGKPSRTMDEKCKDKIILHSIILSVILNNYRPLLISTMAQAFQTSVVKIKKYANIVGCYVEMNSTKTEKLIALRIPLFSMESLNTYKRRRVR